MKVTWLKWGNVADDKSRTGPMIGAALLGSSIVALMATLVYSAKPDADSIPVEKDRAEAARLIRNVLDSKTEDMMKLSKAATQAAEVLGEDSLIARDLLRIAGQATAPNGDWKAIREALESSYKTLTFQPLMEAELPRGFPAPGPLGEIRVKEYPGYRMAVSKSSGAAFWTLFRHIKQNDIAMTAPVEMDYGDADFSKPQEQTMAFLYGDPDMGQAGRDGDVEVVDADPLTVVSIGLNGRRSDTVIENARSQLLAWIAEHPEYDAAGTLRVLGYNSPFVPRDRQFWEVQLPVRKTAEESPHPAQTPNS